MDNNLEMVVERLNPQTFDLHAGVAARELQTGGDLDVRPARQRPAADESVESRQPERVDDDLQLGSPQNLGWGGGNMALTFNNGRVVSPTISWRFDPQYNSSYLFSYTQPLLRGFRIDQTRQQMQTTIINRDNAELNVKARTTNTLAAVRSAYWDYVFSIQAVDVAQQSLSLASKLLSDNKIRVEVGTMAPMDVVQAEAEEATRQQTLTTATATMRTAELSLKRLIVSGTNDPLWSQHIDPVDRPDFQTASIDVEGAVRAALRQRTDLQIARNNFETNNVLLKSLRDQSLPDVDALLLRRGRVGRHAMARQRQWPGSRADRHPLDGGYGNALDTLFDREYPNWQFALNVNYPIGGNARSAGRAHRLADSAEPGADSRHRADGRDRSHQRGASGDERAEGWRPHATRASCRSAGSTPR